MSQYIGRKVRKEFPGYEKPFEGEVTGYDTDEDLYQIEYEDGDKEEMTEHEVLEVLVEEGQSGKKRSAAKGVPEEKGKGAAKKGKMRLLQLRRTRGETAQALSGAPGTSGEAAKGKRQLRSPAEAAAEKHAKRQKQDRKGKAAATPHQEAAPEAGQLGKHNSAGKEAAKTLTMMSGDSHKIPLDSANSGDRHRPEAKAKKTRSLQTLSAGGAPKESDLRLVPASEKKASRPRGRPRKDSGQQRKSSPVKKSQQEGEVNEGTAAELSFIPIDDDQIEAEEDGGKGQPAPGERSTDDRGKRGKGKKAAASGSVAAHEKQRAKGKEPEVAGEAVNGTEIEGEPETSALKVMAIQRGNPTSGAFEGPTRYHNHVIHNGTVYIAGQTANDPSVQDYGAQTVQVLQQLDEQLTAAGSSKNHVLKVNVLLKDIALGANAFNALWEKWIDPEHAPARTTYQASLIHSDLLVEVDALAAVPANLDAME